MAYPAKKKIEAKFTWQDYLTWPDEERWEVIDGIAYNMSPSPTEKHQVIVGNFFIYIKNSLGDSGCRVYIAPLDVKLDDFNFVQPDVMVVCDKKKIKDRIFGAPDLIVEVVSPSTSLKDKREKKKLFERFGVKEYILAYPDETHIERFVLKGGKYKASDIFGANEIFRSSIFKNIEIPLWEVFETEKPGGNEKS